MVRTITEIAGTYGLPQDATADPLKQVEATIMEGVKKTLGEVRSTTEEIAAAKGVSRSTFTEQAQIKQEGDILSTVASQLAGYRAQDVLAQKQAERQILQAGIQTDIQKELIGVQTLSQKELTSQQFENQQTLMNQQAKLAEEAKTADVVRQKEIMAEQTRLQEQINAQQAQFQKEAQAISGGQQLTAIQEQARQNAMLQGVATMEQLKLVDAGQINQLATIAASARSQMDIIDKQYATGELSAANALGRQLTLTQDNLANQINYLREQTAQGKITADNALSAQKELITQGYNNDMAKITELFRQNKITAFDAYQYQTGFTDANGNVQQGLIDKNFNAQKDLATQQAEADMKKLFIGVGSGAQFDANGKYIQGTGGYLAEQGYQNLSLQVKTLENQQAVAKSTAELQFQNALLTKGLDYLLGVQGGAAALGGLAGAAVDLFNEANAGRTEANIGMAGQAGTELVF